MPAPPNTANFNGTAINPGTTIWFNANFKASNVPQKGTLVFFKNQTIEFTAGGQLVRETLYRILD